MNLYDHSVHEHERNNPGTRAPPDFSDGKIECIRSQEIRRRLCRENNIILPMAAI